MPTVETITTHFPAAILARSSSAPTTNKRATAGAIAGGIIGILACLAIIAIIYWFYFRRPRSRYRSSPIDLLGSTEIRKATLYEVHDCKSTCNSNSTTLLAPPPPIHITLPVPPPPVHKNSLAATGQNHGSLPPSFDTTLSCTPNAGAGVGVGFRSKNRNPPLRLQVTNPDPRRESRGQLRLARQAELKAQVIMLRGELSGPKVDLKKPVSSSVSVTNTCTASLAVGSSNCGQSRVPSESFGGTLGSGLTEPAISLQTHHLQSPWTSSVFLDSPPTYSPGGIALASSLAFEPDTKPRA